MSGMRTVSSRRYDKVERVPQMQYIDWGLSIVKADLLAQQPADTAFDLADIYSDLARVGRACRLRDQNALLRDWLDRGSARNRCFAS